MASARAARIADQRAHIGHVAALGGIQDRGSSIQARGEVTVHEQVAQHRHGHPVDAGLVRAERVGDAVARLLGADQPGVEEEERPGQHDRQRGRQGERDADPP